MRKLNYRRKRDIHKGYGQFYNSSREDSREIELNGKDFRLFFEESKFYGNPNKIKISLERM